MDMRKGEMVITEKLNTDISTASHMNDFAIKKRVNQVLEHLILDGKVILDIGCGNGLYTIGFSELGQNTIGIDISEKALMQAQINKLQLNGSSEFIIACAENLPFSNSCFDIVIAIETLEHVNNQEMALREAGRTLKKDGHIVAYVPNRRYPLETHGVRLGEKAKYVLHREVPFFSWAPRFIRKRFETARIYSKREIVGIVEKEGFTVLVVDYMYPPLDRLGSKLSRTLLRSFLSYLERNSITKGFGMSIFVLAKKSYDI